MTDGIYAILAAILASILASILTYIFSLKEKNNIRKKETTINFLIEAWRKLERSANRNSQTDEEKKKIHKNIEEAIADIYLFGKKEEVESAFQISSDMANFGEADFKPLLEKLRNHLREELLLDKVDCKFQSFRFIE